ncbi:MAG: hypothetical protein WCX88_04605, partial [Patescibacteria group bacterium]
IPCGASAEITLRPFSAIRRIASLSASGVAEKGRRVISAEAPHGIDTTNREVKIPKAEARKFELLLSLIEKKDLDKVNIISNSESSIYVAAAAALYPEKFENIVFIEPAGLIGNDNFWDLLKRNMQEAKEDERQSKLKEKVKYPSSASIGMRSIFSNLPASIKEIDAIAHADITMMLEQIHNAGIGISIIHAVDDKIFPMEKIQKIIKAHTIDGFYSVSGGHNSIYLYEPFGRAAEAALSALENKKDTKNKNN